MSAAKNNQSMTNLSNALARLEEALREPADAPLVVDGTIQRFEFVIELYWKTFSRLLADEGVPASTPKDAIRNAYKAGWIDDEEAWIAMIADRNATSHVYNEEQALRIYQRIRAHLPALQRGYQALVRRIGPIDAS